MNKERYTMKNFKKLAAFALAATMSLGLLTACGGGTTGTTETPANTETPASTESTAPETETPAADGTFTTVEDGKLIMSTNATFPPYEMVADGDGVNGSGYEGIDIEIAYALADKLGLELVIDDMDFDAALLAVQNNSADMMLAGLSYSEERDEVVDFSDPYATGVQVVIVKEGSDVTLDNLGDYMIGTQRGTTGYLYASDTPENGGYGEDHVIGYDSGVTAVQELINGTIDAVIIDKQPAEAYVAANPDAGLTILPGNWVEEDYCLAVDEGNTALLNALNTALNELKSDGTLDEIVAKYINAE
ncbi:transporter substrate-binding domain-containing protein [uncultured Flavonifractor sp.]|uniref:transporter substrate-binding domain-containing protein n=1 Tax=uncultured Flavonifractor sp. TaxID=1193534 RepID=UPI0025E059C7|nr:transporter substrate-binding domain-containing protein [uncultured Flavonifractor sp.]